MRRAVLAMVLLAVAGCGTAVKTSGESGPTLGGGYVALGDSYTAAPGVPTTDQSLCQQSDHDYPHLLAAQVGDLVAAGLRRVNVSLDSLAADRFFQLTRRDSLGRVLEGLAAAQEHPELRPIKVNAVALRGFTEDEARWVREAFDDCDLEATYEEEFWVAYVMRRRAAASQV